MTELHPISVKLSEGQKNKIAKAYKNSEEVKIRLISNRLITNAFSKDGSSNNR